MKFEGIMNAKQQKSHFDKFYSTTFSMVTYYYVSIFHNYLVGQDFTTLTGEETIKAVLAKGSNITSVEVLIHHDIESEGEESFTAELQSDSQNASATVIIRDVFTVLCQFDQPAYDVYESVGNADLTINCSSRGIYSSRYSLKVETVYGSGNASGE